MTTVDVIVLTMGDRPNELAAAVRSARANQISVSVTLVINGGNADRSLADTVLDPANNLGIPGGRNVGAAAGNGDIICFLDDDGLLREGVLDQVGIAFGADEKLGSIGFRIVDEFGATARRYVPGLRKDPNRSGPSTAFPGGGCAIRRAAFEQVGGFCAPFQYGLEETDLAWRLINAGWSVSYRADLIMKHPRTSPTRHTSFVTGTARNRVWLAHRLLPLPVGMIYIVNWSIVTAARNITRPRVIAAHIRGTIAGLRKPTGPREPIRWRTLLELCRIGRPPLI